MVRLFASRNDYEHGCGLDTSVFDKGVGKWSIADNFKSLLVLSRSELLD